MSHSSSFLPRSDEPAPQPEVARMFRQRGLQYVVASQVRIASMQPTRPAWLIDDAGEISDSPEDNGSAVFAGAAAAVGGLIDAELDDARIQRLSPRRWALVWRSGDDDAIVAEAQYREKRDAIDDVDIALVRLVCSISAGPDAGAADGTSTAGEAARPAQNGWPAIDRRRRTQPSRLAWLTVALPALAALLCAWLLLFVLPQVEVTAAGQQAQIEQLNKTTEATMTTALATVMAGGDYGLAQDELSQFARLGYFQSAVVLNAKGQMVALAGPVGAIRIGDVAPSSYADQARSRKLSVGSQNYGQLLFVVPTTAAASSMGGAKVAALLAALACVAAALLLAWMLRRAL
jgi:hypothetical protein